MLRIVGTALILGLLTGIALRGRIRHLDEVRPAGTSLAYAALAIMVAESLADLGDPVDRVLVAAGYGLAAAFLIANIARSRGGLRLGFAMLALGWLLNTTVIFANGGMPLSQAAYAASGQTAAPTPGQGGFFKIVLTDETTVLRPLGDVIPLRTYHQVVSIGDLVLMTGLVVTLAAAMRGASASSASRGPAREDLVLP